MISQICSMVLLSVGNSDHVAHAGRKICIFWEKTAQDPIKSLNPLIRVGGEALYAPPPVVFCPLLKKSSGNPYLKIHDFSHNFIADAPKTISPKMQIWNISWSFIYNIFTNVLFVFLRIKIIQLFWKVLTGRITITMTLNPRSFSE